MEEFAGMIQQVTKGAIMISEKTVGLIRQILEMDSEVTEEEKDQILKNVYLVLRDLLT